MSDGEAGELERVKAALTDRGFRHRDGRTQQEFELFREVGNVREAVRLVKLGGRGDKAPWVVDTWDHAWTGETAEAALEAVEARYRADAARALRRADELGELRREVAETPLPSGEQKKTTEQRKK